MRQERILQKTSQELKKHVGLIHSTNKFSLLERKIANALLYNAYDELITKSEHSIHIAQLSFLIGYNSKDYKTIKKSLIALLSTVLEWNIIDKNKKEDDIWVASSMLADAKIDGPICTYSYSNRLKELCYHPEFYGKLNMKVLAAFKSSYGLALYENCIRYQNIIQTPWLDLITYRKLMGVEEGEYKNFKDLNKRVIKPAVAEVNKYSSITIETEFKKQGRDIMAIKFLITKKIVQKDVPPVKAIDETVQLGKLTEFLVNDYGFLFSNAQELIKQYGEQYILSKIKMIESSSSYNNGKILNLTRYLQKALIEDYQPSKSSKDHLKSIKNKKETLEKNMRLQEEKAQQYRAYQNKEIPNIFNNLSAKIKANIIKEFDKYIAPTLYYNAYIKEGLNNPLVLDRFCDFIREQHSSLLIDMKSFDVFCVELKITEEIANAI